MKNHLLSAIAVLSIVLASCSQGHLITDESLLQDVEKKYSDREALFGKSSPELFALVNNAEDIQKREALEYLIAYMPLNDIADFDVQLLDRSVDVALQAREEMPWGNMPVSLFLSFVLPPRVNNENLDSFRIAYYDEITQRVKDMTAMEAALEINHWCHEKVAYQPSDIRTSAPLATILSARGRCGEESTFAVSALRTAGLPARQVYTPRWAHTDDNHAWVEVWVNGKWHYMGACEPEPVPDRGWFTEPARRAMLVHTKAFGSYSGEGLIMKQRANYAELNTLPDYAVTKQITVVVTDSTGKAVADAVVDFGLYNYAELYPIASLATGTDGLCTFVTGLGDLVIWAHKKDNFDFAHVSIADTDTLRLTIKNRHLTGTMTFDLKAPVARTPLPGPSPELVKLNALRISREDSIRNAYISTWMKMSEADSIAAIAGLSSDAVRRVIKAGMGNYRSVTAFLTGAGDKSALAMTILENVSEKDLRDADYRILNDHLNNAPVKSEGVSDEIYNRYVVSPRVDNEKLSGWRTALRQLLPQDLLDSFTGDPSMIINWIDENIAVDTTENYYNVPMTPGGVARLRMADAHSIKIFFVALCRTLGIPSRLEQATGRPQYYSSGRWNDVWFAGENRPSEVKSYVTFTTGQKNPAPAYFTHFTLARFDKGRYQTLEFDYGSKAGEMANDIPLDPGRYMLLTGNRINDVTVLASASFFELQPGEHKKINVEIRLEEETPAVIGSFDYHRQINTIDGHTMNLDSLAGKGLVALWIKPGTEPTRHVFADLPMLKEEFDRWGGCFVFFIDMQASGASFNPSQYSGLPANSVFAADNGCALLESVFPGRNLQNGQFPVITYSDAEGKILFFSDGYRIGIGDQIIKRIN